MGGPRAAHSCSDGDASAVATLSPFLGRRRLERETKVDARTRGACSRNLDNGYQRPPRSYLVQGCLAFSNAKTVFQSDFMLTTIHLFAVASSSALSSLPTCDCRS